MIKRLFLLTALVLLDVSGAWAQLGQGKPKDIAVVKSQPLLVLLLDEDPDKLKKLAKKPQELADYKAFVADYNKQMQELVPKLWKFSPAVEFKQESELEALRKATGTQYSVLRHADLYFSSRHHMGGTPMGAAGTYFYSSEKVSAFELLLVGNGDRSTVARQFIAPGPVYSSDIIFTVLGVQHYMQDRAAGRNGSDMKAELAKNGKQLRTKTLLIDEEDVKNKLTAADIKKAYPFPYKVVPRATIEEAVVNSDARYACARLFPAAESLMIQVVMSAADGSVLAFSKPNTVRVMGIGGGQAIGKNNLEDFAEYARGK